MNIAPLTGYEFNETIIIKEIDGFIRNISDEALVFFSPPNGDVEIEEYSDEIRILIGYANSEDYNNHREIYFNVLTGNVYTKRYEPEEE